MKNDAMVERDERLERALRDLEATADIAFAVGAETNLHRILELIAQRARVPVSADSLVILLRDEDDLRVVAHAGSAKPAPDSRMPIKDTASGLALTSQRPQLVGDAQADLGVPTEILGAPDARNALIVPLVFRGRALGVILALDHMGAQTGFASGDERSLRAFAASAATAVYTARTVEKQRLRDSLESAEAERKRWARNLHDETLQGLGAIKLKLDLLNEPEDASDRGVLEDAIELVNQQIAGLREIITDLRPAALDELGLEPALRTLAARTEDRDGLHVTVDFDPVGERLPREIETVTYRIAQEALTNVLRHADARRVRIEVARDGEMLRMCVADDGRGFDHEPSGGFGLLGMWERATLAGGDFEVEQADPGTRIVLLLPLAGKPVWP